RPAVPLLRMHQRVHPCSACCLAFFKQIDVILHTVKFFGRAEITCGAHAGTVPMQEIAVDSGVSPRTDFGAIGTRRVVDTHMPVLLFERSYFFSIIKNWCRNEVDL